MSDLQQAIDRVKAQQPNYDRFVNYYSGNHNLAFASEKFQNTFGNTLKNMRDNLCPIVVDAPADRMEIINFSGADKEKKNAIAEKAWEIWQRETLELVSNDVHKEALKCGCGYVIVWVDNDKNARFYAQDARQCAVIEDEDTGDPLFAVKQWTTLEKKIRITLYYTDRIEKYISQKEYGNDTLKDTSFIPYSSDTENAITDNPYGVIPMFKFETQPVLNDAIPIQDALNKTMCDELVSQEFAAFPQRWAVGLELPENEITGKKEMPFLAGIDRLWNSEDKDSRFGQFLAADLEKFLKVEDSRRLEMARVTGTPLHFFSIQTGNAVSGEALKTLESRFTKKVKRLCVNFGVVWSKAMKLALAIEGTAIDADETLTAQWESPEQRSELEFFQTLLLKQELGVPEEVLFEEAGYTVEDIAKFKQLQAEEPPPSKVNMQGQKVDANGVPITNDKQAQANAAPNANAA